MSEDKLVKQRGRKAVIYRGAECLNCAHPLELSDKYCSYCGQLNTTKQLSLKDFFGEFIGSILTYDSRFRYTLKDLLFKPGTITKNYCEGQRLKYANPFRFFLSVSIIYFLIQGLISTFSGGDNSFMQTNNGTNAGIPTQAALDSLSAKGELALDSLSSMSMTLLDSINSKGKGFNSSNNKFGPNIKLKQDTLIIEGDTILTKKKPKKEEEFRYVTEAELDTIEWSNRVVERFVFYYKFYKETEIKDPKIALDSMKHENSRFNRWVYNKNEAIERVKSNPAEFGNYIAGKVPFFLFFFTPLFAFFFWLIYSKKKYSYIEHMIFIFHIFTFLFLGMIIAILPDMLIGEEILAGILFVIIGPFYFYKALRNFYKQSRIITIIKFVFLNIVFFVSSMITALIFFALTAAVY